MPFSASELYEEASLCYNGGKEVKGLPCNGKNRDIWFCFFAGYVELEESKNCFAWYPFHYFFLSLFCFVS